MELNVTHRYDHPADEVFAVLTSFEAVKAKYEALGHSDVTLVSRDEAADGGVTVVTHRIVPLDVPGFAKKVLSPKNSVTQTDRWSGPDTGGVRTGTFTVEAKGVPVSIGGTLRLAPAAEGCTNTITATITCKVPLIGGKIADLVGGDTKKAVTHEEIWTREHLAGR